ncbi:MAG: NAD(P)H-hydrate dehydratase [bacterium]
MDIIKPIFQEKPLYPKILWNRPIHQYKANAGKIFIISGSKGMSGRALIVCEAVFRSGTGILLLGFPEGLKNDFKGILPESMSLPLPQTNQVTLSSNSLNDIIESSSPCDAAIIGPGLSMNPETVQVIWEVITTISIPLVIAEEGLSSFCKGLEVIRRKESVDYIKNIILDKLPNRVIIMSLSEVRKLLDLLDIDKLNDKEISSNIYAHLSTLSRALGFTIILAASPLAISSPDGVTVVNKIKLTPQNLSSSQISVLAGVIGSFMGQNPKNIFQSIVTAIYIFESAMLLAINESSGDTNNISGSTIIRFLSAGIKKAEDI